MLGSFTKGPAQLTEGNVKTGNYLNHVLQLETARQQGYHEAVLCNHLGHVLECTTSNLFWFQGDTLCTPSLNQGVLNGITRQLTLESAAILKIEVMEGQFALETFLQADEAFITSTTRDILPVRRVREKFFSIGPLTKKLSKQFQSMGWEME
jgi:branched-subunit amino acid aminotransferase/4-amino-4-deoxychorismate lyase